MERRFRLWFAERQEQWIVPVTTCVPSVTLTLKSPCATPVNETVAVPLVGGGTVAVPVAPCPGLTLALYLPVPPLIRNWNVLALHVVLPPPIGNSLGMMASVTTG